MSGRKVVNRSEILNDRDRIFSPLEARIKGVVLDVLEGVASNLEQELQGIGLEVMRTVMELEIAQVAGAKGKHQPDRSYTRHGTNPGSVLIDGRKVTLPVPRAVAVDTNTAYRLSSYPLFRQAGAAVKKAYQDLIRGVSTRRFKQGVSQFLAGHGLSSATASRHMVTATKAKVEELFGRPLGGLHLVVLMLDGVKVGGTSVVIALGIDENGKKHLLGLAQGATENARVVTTLLEDLVGRGLSTDRPMLVVIDGAKALRKAVDDVLGAETAVQRCTVHKKRNVLDLVPESERSRVSRRLSVAYDLAEYSKAKAELESVVKDLQRINPTAARSLEEGLEETLTVQRLELPELLRISLRSTNIIESANNGVRDRARNVKRWMHGEQIERWTAAGLLETEKNFRRIKGCNEMQVLIAALDNERKDKSEAA
jgi:putative transposase